MAIETPLLFEPVNESVDYKGRSVYRFNSGGWKSALFIIDVEVAERSAYYGIAGNFLNSFLISIVIKQPVAALVETKRLKTAQEYGLVDTPNVTIPMSVWWLIPQNILLAAADVFIMIGMQEFFYDQVPTELRSVGLALFLSIIGVGNFLSSFLISIIDKATGGDGHYSWFDNNLNRAHLDYFYWLLAVLSTVQWVAFLYCAKSYIYNRGGATREQ